jgi:4'-phosphopantetheinyl transferase
MHSMIGYHLHTENSLCGMAMTQGIRKRVVNIGMASKQVVVEPRGVPVLAYVESQSHKVS